MADQYNGRFDQLQGAEQQKAIQQYEAAGRPSGGWSYDPSVALTTPLAPPVTPPVAALTVPETAQPLFASNMFDESPDAKAARNAALDAERVRRTGEATDFANTNKGGVTGQFQKGSRTGTGYDSIKESQISEINKQLTKTISGIEGEIAQAKLTGNAEAEATSMKKMELALKIKDQADTAALNQAQLKLSALTGAANIAASKFEIMSKIPAGTSQTIDGVEYTGIATPDPFYTSASLTDLMLKLPEGTSKSVTDPNTGHVYDITGMGSTTDGNQIFKDVNQNTGTVTFTTMDKAGNVVKQVTSKGIGAVYKAGSGSNNSGFDNKKAEQQFIKFLSGTKPAVDAYSGNTRQVPIQGANGFVSPDDYLLARNSWTQQGGNPTDFDSAFKGFRDPNNKNYAVSAVAQKQIIGDPNKPIVYQDSTQEIHQQ